MANWGNAVAACQDLGFQFNHLPGGNTHGIAGTEKYLITLALIPAFSPPGEGETVAASFANQAVELVKPVDK